MATARDLDNDWMEPYHVFGEGEDKLRKSAVRRLGDYRIRKEEWQRATEESDRFLHSLTSNVQGHSRKYGEELSVCEDYVKQASGRQGLKINSPDEFDLIQPIHLADLDLQLVKTKNTDGKIVPGFNRLRVMNRDVRSTHPRLFHEGMLQQVDGNVYLSSKNLHEKVYAGLADKALDAIRKEYPDYKIVRSVHPPTIEIQVTPPSGKATNYDLVPAIFFKEESIRIPEKITGKKAQLVKLPIYFVPKQDNRNNSFFKEKDRSLIWRMDTSSHERCMADLCRSSKERQYIMTANRILKSAIQQLQRENQPVGRVINSYHLKTIAYSTVYELTMTDSNGKLNGVKDALGHQISRLRTCLAERYLPDRFQGNKATEEIFPGSMLNRNHREQNLFWKVKPQSLLLAKDGMPQLLDRLSGFYTCVGGLG
jgi:hypothetical protein